MLHLLPLRTRPFPAPTLIGPVLYRKGGYAFDRYSVEHGFVRSFSYRSVEEALYDRKMTLCDPLMLACATTDIFESQCVAMMPEELKLCA